jgi:hypothetical protein
LIIARHGVKPAVAMKTLSRTFRFVVLTVIVIVVVVSCCNFPSIPDKRISLYTVEIGNEKRGQYVEWKSQGAFDSALEQVCWSHHPGHGWYEFYTDADRTHPYKPCPPPRGTIRTVKVTKSKAADKIAAGEPVANDPNVMHRIQSPNPDDIVTVLDALK